MQDINLNDLVGAILGKGNKYAAITFSETAKKHLEEYLDIRGKILPHLDFEYVFTPYTMQANQIFTEQALNRLIKTIGEKAGVKTKTNTHIYRHTLATHLVQSGYSIVQVRDKLRHSSLTVTNMYTHSSPFEQMSLTKNIDTNILASRNEIINN